MGRPHILTERIHDRLLQAIRAGAYYSEAAQFAGIHRDTLYTWLKRGRDEKARREEGEEGDPSEEPFVMLADAISRAESEAVVEAVAHWKRAAAVDWRAAKEWLARRHGQRWGEKSQITHTGPEGGPVELNVRTVEQMLGEAGQAEGMADKSLEATIGSMNGDGA